MKPDKLAAQPPPADVNALLALYNARRYAEAESQTRALLKRYPDFAFGWQLLGGTLQMQRKDALAAFQKVVQLQPDNQEAHFNQGVVLRGAGQLEQAAASYRRALALNPDYAEAFANLGNTYKDLGRADDAIASYRRAAALKPDFAVYYNLGNALKEQGRLDDAVGSYRKAVELNPRFADAHNNLGAALKDLGQFGAALDCYRRVLELRPDFAEAHNNLGVALKDFGQLEAALDCYRKAVALQPEFTETHSSLLFTLNYMSSHTPAYCLAEAREYGRRVSRTVTARFSSWRCVAQPQRLRVGIVSGDLHNHPVGYFLESLLAQLDPARIELIAYQTDTLADALTVRLKPHFAAWKSLFNLSDADAARLIHADGVYVLLDLAGHTSKNRLPVFAWKPAPVQASWLGYFATTGLAEMDYLLADETGVPATQRGNFSETIWYLPDTRLCFTPPETNLPVAALPAQKNGYVTFGCFQNLAKAGDEVLTIWAKIFDVLPDATLRWQCKLLGDPAVVEQLALRLQQHGINPARVTMHGAVSREAYLAAHSEVDVILDTFPFPGGTTTCEALWMGVPTLTLAGDTLLSRQGASLLTAVGLNDLVANSEADYIAKAVALASDLPGLAALRAGLREQARTSTLYDAQRFARNFEAALWGMWQAKSQ
ncbi:MAG: tetratricopeptide repeat protein [Nitrosomonadales bacterium]|nr:tetratricopeptide repeat protein [Nitrosomonadales bacterium]